MSLHLTSCTRADVSPYQASELARRIEQGDVSIHDPANGADPGKQYLVRKHSNAHERDLIVAALKAFA